MGTTGNPTATRAALLRLLVACVAVRLGSSCTEFAMRQKGYTLSARNEDFAGLNPWFVVSVPVGTTTTTGINPPGVAPWSYRVEHGYVAFMENASALEYLHGDGPGLVMDGLNDEGLSVGAMTLVNSSFPPPDPKGRNVHVTEARNYLLATCANVSEAVAALLRVTVWATTASTTRRRINHHLTLRDAAGDAVVVEFLGGEMKVHHAAAGDPAAALGVVTNEPELPWHLRNVEHWRWKRTLTEPAVAFPGGFYPDDRFIRALVLRDAARFDPPSLEAAVADAFGVLASVAVPLGVGVPGTDTGSNGGEQPHTDELRRRRWGEEGGGEKLGDHTRWSVVRDHSAEGLGYYWRDESNPGVRRLLLRDAHLGEGKSRRAWSVSGGQWFVDAERDEDESAGSDASGRAGMDATGGLPLRGGDAVEGSRVVGW